MYTQFKSLHLMKSIMSQYSASLFVPLFRHLPVKGVKGDHRLKVLKFLLLK